MGKFPNPKMQKLQRKELPRNKSLQNKKTQTILWVSDGSETVVLWLPSSKKESFKQYHEKKTAKKRQFNYHLSIGSVLFLRKTKQDNFPILKRH